jgi:phosphatidylserine/phosphatidylglycerophosphate/cardiolipin synthase-like enzyme
VSPGEDTVSSKSELAARRKGGSYNFSPTADTKNGENLLLVRDRRVAVSYALEAMRMIDHYHWRVRVASDRKAKKELVLAKPPRLPGEDPWWLEDYTDPRKIRDREMFSGR